MTSLRSSVLRVLWVSIKTNLRVHHVSCVKAELTRRQQVYQYALNVLLGPSFRLKGRSHLHSANLARQGATARRREAHHARRAGRVRIKFSQDKHHARGVQ
jgi:hypothetical protein